MYELATLINWEMAGFLPFAFETAWKDTVLGSSNLHYDWYALFKEKTQSLLLQGDAHGTLIKAVYTLKESKNRQVEGIPSQWFRKRWIKR
jgi:hypothetical protein